MSGTVTSPTLARGRVWTPQDEQLLLTMLRGPDVPTSAQIAAALDRSVASIHGKLQLMGRSIRGSDAMFGAAEALTAFVRAEVAVERRAADGLASQIEAETWRVRARVDVRRRPARECEWPMWGDGERATGLYCGSAIGTGRCYCNQHTAQAALR